MQPTKISIPELNIRNRLFLLLQHVAHFLHQFRTRKWNAHDFIISICIYKVLIADDFDQLSVIEFGN